MILKSRDSRKVAIKVLYAPEQPAIKVEAGKVGLGINSFNFHSIISCINI